MNEPYGYVLVHFVEDPRGHGEKVYVSRSDPGSANRWHRMNGGRPILESTIGTTGVRDPFLVRTDDGFVLLATDLRIYGGDGAGWDAWRRRGSRSLLVWESPDLVTWSGPRLVEVAPPEAGMAWAPEAIRDPVTGEFVVFWSSRLYASDDPGHAGASYSRILSARTRDFHRFSPAEVLVDTGRSVIDMCVIVEDGRVHRFLKEDADEPQSRLLYHEAGSDLSSADFTVLAERIGDDLYSSVEAPIVFRDLHAPRWYLLIDQYETPPQGYLGLWTDDLESGRWTPFDPDEFVIPPATKHGAVVPVDRAEWEALERLDIS